MESVGLYLSMNTISYKFCILNEQEGEIKILLWWDCGIRDYCHNIYYNNNKL